MTVVLVIVVIGLSLAMQSQQTAQGTRSQRPARPARGPAPTRRARRPQPPAADIKPPSPGPVAGEADVPPPDLLRTGEETDAKVISVVDERTIGPVTRSRLTVEISPPGGDPFEVTTRVAFPTQEARARVRVGGTVKVHYDKEDHSRVVVDVSSDAGSESSPGDESDGPNDPVNP